MDKQIKGVEKKRGRRKLTLHGMLGLKEGGGGGWVNATIS